MPLVSNAAKAKVGARVARRSTPRLRPVDGGLGYYGRFTNALPSKPSYFPIGVWFESAVSQREINLDKDVGLNTYVVLTGNSNLSLVRRNGMKAILQQDEWQPSAAAGRRPPAGAPGRDRHADEYRRGLRGVTAHQGRSPRGRTLRYNNFGKGVVFWLNNFEAGRYVNAVDLPRPTSTGSQTTTPAATAREVAS